MLGTAPEGTIQSFIRRGGVSGTSAPVNSVVPTISGNMQVGQALSTTNGSWTNSPTGYTYQWKRGGSNIAAATANTYTLAEADAGQSITCAVTASNGIGTGSPATSNSLLIDVYLVYLANIVDATDATIYSGGVWNGASLGVVAPNRKIVIGVGTRASVTRTLSSLSVAGITATKVVNELNSGASNVQTAAMFAADVPTGTTGDVVVTWSGLASRCSVGLWAVYGAASTTPNVTATSIANATTTDLNLPQGTAVISYAFVNSTAAPTPVWNGLTTSDFSAVVETTLYHGGAEGSFHPPQTVTFSDAWINVSDKNYLWAGWAPAAAVTLSDILLSDGVRTWFNSPSSIVLGGSLYAGGVKADGSVIVGTNDIAATVLHSALQVDDHINPALLARSLDGKIVAAYTKHSADNNMFVRISSAAGDVSAFGAEANIGATLGIYSWAYARLVEITDGMFLFCRAFTGTDYKMIYSTSTDGGVTWSAGTIWHNGPARPYFQISKTAANRFDILINDGNPNETASCSTYHFYYEAGTWKKSNGSSIGSPPFTTSQFTRIWDGTGGVKSWPWDIALINGQVRAVYAVFPTTLDHRYRYASLSGGAWSDAEICTAGGTLYASAGTEDYYSGGVCLDPDDATRIFCSRAVSGPHQLYRGVTADGGATFTLTQLLTNPVKNFRPAKIAGTNYVSYVTGAYTTYTSYATSIRRMLSSQA